MASRQRSMRRKLKPERVEMAKARQSNQPRAAAGSLSLMLPDGSMIDAVDLARPGVVVGVQGEDFGPGSEPGHTLNEVEEDEIDEDPPSE